MSLLFSSLPPASTANLAPTVFFFLVFFYFLFLFFSLSPGQVPYADISEPAHIYYDGANKRSRIEYYAGQDTYIYRADVAPYGLVCPLNFCSLLKCFFIFFIQRNTASGTLFQVIPEIMTMSCVQTNGTSDAPQTTVQGMIPDLSTFTLSSQQDYHRGVLCDVYQYTFTQGGKVNTYNFFVSSATQSPVSFHFLGYDQVF